MENLTGNYLSKDSQKPACSTNVTLTPVDPEFVDCVHPARGKRKDTTAALKMLRSVLQRTALIRAASKHSAPSTAAFSNAAIPQPITSPDIHYTGVSSKIAEGGVTR